MSRSATRTASMVLDDVNRIVNLFGTVMNAFRMLGLQELGITYAQFYRGMHFESVTPQQKQLIEEAWERWRFLFIKDEVPLSADFTLTADNRDHTPSWHPEHEEEDPDEEAPRRVTAQRE